MTPRASDARGTCEVCARSVAYRAAPSSVVERTTTDPKLVTCARCEVHAATCRASSALVVTTYASLVSAVRAWQQGASTEQAVIRALDEIDAVACVNTDAARATRASWPKVPR